MIRHLDQIKIINKFQIKLNKIWECETFSNLEPEWPDVQIVCTSLAIFVNENLPNSIEVCSTKWMLNFGEPLKNYAESGLGIKIMDDGTLYFGLFKSGNMQVGIYYS